MRTVRTLLAGDHFVGNDLLEAALTSALPDVGFDFTRVTLPWPLTPYGRVAEVDEASDAEEPTDRGAAGHRTGDHPDGPVHRTRPRCRAGPPLPGLLQGWAGQRERAGGDERGIVVSSTPGRNAIAAAEHAVALMLGALRNLPRLQKTLEQGEWRSDLYAYDDCGSELDGATVGLVGYGAIGSRVAKVMLAFGARVLVVDPVLDRRRHRTVRRWSRSTSCCGSPTWSACTPA